VLRQSGNASGSRPVELSRTATKVVDNENLYTADRFVGQGLVREGSARYDANMSSMVSAGLRQAVDAVSALRPPALSVEELQTAIAAVTALAGRLGGWVDTAVGELTARGTGPYP